MGKRRTGRIAGRSLRFTSESFGKVTDRSETVINRQICLASHEKSNIRYSRGDGRRIYEETVMSSLKRYQRHDHAMKLMSLCGAPLITFLVAKLYDNVITIGSRTVEFCKACIAEIALVKGSASDILMAFCLSGWWTL